MTSNVVAIPDCAREVSAYTFSLLRFGIVDERQAVVDQWRDVKLWIVPPVAVSCDLVGGGAGLGLLIDYTRLGNLLARAGARGSTGVSDAFDVGRGTRYCLGQNLLTDVGLIVADAIYLS
jgi:hypothetical protein